MRKRARFHCTSVVDSVCALRRNRVFTIEHFYRRCHPALNHVIVVPVGNYPGYDPNRFNRESGNNVNINIYTYNRTLFYRDQRFIGIKDIRYESNCRTSFRDKFIRTRGLALIILCLVILCYFFVISFLSTPFRFINSNRYFLLENYPLLNFLIRIRDKLNIDITIIL